jgi:hypothetical protein
VTPTHEQIAQRAYQLWEQRGRPSGEPEVDWGEAERELQSKDSNTIPTESRSRPVTGPVT